MAAERDKPGAGTEEERGRASDGGRPKGGRRKALVVGIDDYPGTANDLPSCVADARLFRELLVSQFAFPDVHTLLNADATVARLEQELDWLFADAAADDRLVFFYSGHGYQAPRGGTLEEFLVMGDGQLFQDDALAARSQKLPDGVLTCVFDSCFSGGMDKVLVEFGASPFSVFEKSDAGKIKFFVPESAEFLKDFAGRAGATRYKPFGRVARPIVGPHIPERKSLVVEPTIVNAPGDEAGQQRLKGLLLSACREGEKGAASTAATNGLSAFTYSLSKAIAALGPRRSSRELMTRALAELRRVRVPQTPQIKEPVKPAGASALSFIDLKPVGGDGSKESPDGVSGLVDALSGVDANRAEAATDDVASRLIAFVRALQQTEVGAMPGTSSSVADILPLILPLLRGGGGAQGGGDKNFLNDALRVISIVGPLLKGGQSAEKSFDFTPFILPFLAPQQEKSTLGDIGRIIETLGPLFKGGQAADKGWLDDALRIVTIVGPLLKSSPAPQKGFADLLPVLLPLLKSGGGAQQKGFGDFLPLILPLLKQSQQQPADKGWFNDVLSVAAVVVPLLA